ncbi:MAG TPA: 6,7-dimethyl-8-ribityllumazine synthase [Tepidisphaeraceae bacterium]|jgi:6,7-dimethyl-8-ribityllumazine synthase
MSTHSPAAVKIELPPDVRVGVVAARFNAYIVDVLLQQCVEQLQSHGVDEFRIDVHRVPGAFELPVAAKLLAATKRYRAVICLGCVVRGDTPHFDFVAGEAARGIGQVAIEESLPVIFGVLTTNTEEQAVARTNGAHSHAGRNAADAAVEMIALGRAIRSA